jgi:hypothetical protein
MQFETEDARLEWLGKQRDLRSKVPLKAQPLRVRSVRPSERVEALRERTADKILAKPFSRKERHDIRRHEQTTRKRLAQRDKMHRILVRKLNDAKVMGNHDAVTKLTADISALYS